MTGTDRSLRADCERCFALCCVAPAFSASSDFAISKPAGTPCPKLQSDFRCGIHTSLRQQGFRGCAVYDCFGAGQRVSQETFGGQDWRGSAPATQMFDVFHAVRTLHELLWYLAEALIRIPAGPLRAEVADAQALTEEIAGQGADALLTLDMAAHRGEISLLLRRVSEMVRAGVLHRKDRVGADLMGAKLRSADLRGANLRGALLVGADLRGADLRMADVIGADFRDADLAGADLTGSLFLIQSQLTSAKGDAATTLPAPLDLPSHWR